MQALLSAGGKKLTATSKGALLAAAVTGEKQAVEELIDLGAGKGKEGKQIMRLLCKVGPQDAYDLLHAKGLDPVSGECAWDSDGD